MAIITWGFVSLILALVSKTHGFPSFRDEIPNGRLVVHPCNTSMTWDGVGHVNAQGGGLNNQFGKDFKANGRKWTKALCEADSDGDGRTNGEELGDPKCVWKKNAVVARATNITHPGVCDPVDSPVCKAMNDSTCSTESKFKCAAIKKDKDVKKIPLMIDRTKVPVVETTYMCQYVEFPTDATYDVIASEAVIDNTAIAHHIVVYGCDRDANGTKFRKPGLCGMGMEGCNTYLAGWTYGSYGTCYPADIGLRIGQEGWASAVIQIHWNNPQRIDSYYDHSGLIFHYTPNLRKFAESTMMIGLGGFEIPPGKKSHIETAMVTEECSYLKHPGSIFIHNVYLHMHYLGHSASLKQMRDGKLIRTIAADKTYSYDLPVFHDIVPAVEYKKGDELLLTCEFNSESRVNTTYNGDATSDEMCIAFVAITPYTRSMARLFWYRNILDFCTQYSHITGGDSDQAMGFFHNSRCHATTYALNERPKMLRRVVAHCNTTDMSCNEDCVKQLKIHAEHPCHDKSLPGLDTFVNYHLSQDKDKTKAEFTSQMAEKCAKHLLEKEDKKTPEIIKVNVCVSHASLTTPAFKLSLVAASLILLKNFSC